MMRDLVFGGSEHIGFTAMMQRRADKIDVETTAEQLAERLSARFRAGVGHAVIAGEARQSCLRRRRSSQ